MARRRLKKGSITLRELLELSYALYKNGEADDKRKRVKLDLVSGKITRRRNLEYNFSTRQWEQTNPYGVVFQFMVKSSPISYKKEDRLKYHIYPVFFHFLDITKKLDSPVKIRTGSQHRWKTARKGASKEERLKILERNLKVGLHGDFLFSLMNVYSLYDLLYGIDTTNHRLPLIKNKQLNPYLDKTALYTVEKILLPILNDKKSPLMNKIFKNV